MSLAVDPDAQDVTLDGHRLDKTSRSPLFIDPGEHVLVSLALGGERVLSFEVQAGETRELALLSPAPAIERTSETTPSLAVEHSTGGHQFSLWARADIDGLGRGMLGSGGQQVSGNRVAIDPTYGLNESPKTHTGACSAACTKITTTNVAGACCTCEGKTKKYAKSAWNAATYLCQ